MQYLETEQTRNKEVDDSKTVECNFYGSGLWSLTAKNPMPFYKGGPCNPLDKIDRDR